MSNLYIVATPIGNLEDITLRALRILKEVDIILAEDTRVTRKLLSHYDIKTKVISYHEHSDDKKNNEIFKLLEDGKNLALVTDAGTPAISDPGSRLVNLVREKDAANIIPIPGPSALSAVLSISGIVETEFIFMGFPPHKKGRQTFFHKIESAEFPVIFYESKHRIVKALETLSEFAPNKKIMLFKEITKMNENFFEGSAIQVLEKLMADENLLKGEFVVIVK